MPRKHNDPDRLLADVIAALEGDEPRAHYKALLSLLSSGPFVASDALLRATGAEALNRNLDVVSQVRAELLAFLRDIVKDRNRDAWSHGLGTYRPLTFSATQAGDRVAFDVTGDVRDVIVVQLVTLVMRVGLSSVRKCEAPDCEHLYVKVHKRVYCSVRCQSRTRMRERRERERYKRERAARRRREKTSSRPPVAISLQKQKAR